MVNILVVMRANFFMAILLLLVFAFEVNADNSRFTLVIDAGHGGYDHGAPGAFSKEKDINLKVALAFGKLVESQSPDVRLVYTRKTDVFVPLKERANIANQNKADLFISVHTNALDGGKIARGFETFTLGMHRAKDNLDVAMRENSVIIQEKNYQRTYQGFDPKSSESYIMFELMQGANMERSVDLAKMIQRSVCSIANRPDKGVHQAGFLVLRETSMPSCLIELGFITTPDEEQALNDEKQLQLIAQGLYQAFLNYKQKYQGVQGKALQAIKSAELPDIKKTGISLVHPIVEKDDTVSQYEQVATLRNDKTVSQPMEGTEKVLNRSQSLIHPLEKKPKSNSKSEAIPSKRKKDVDTSQASPIFKIQIFAGKHQLRFNDPRFKGLEGCESFDDGKMIRYTYGASKDYNEILKLRNQIVDKFPEAFVVAFKSGVPMNLNEAIKEFLKAKKNK